MSKKTRNKKYNPYKYNPLHGYKPEEEETVVVQKPKSLSEVIINVLFPSRVYRNLPAIQDGLDSYSVFYNVFDKTDVSKFKTINEYYYGKFKEFKEHNFRAGKYLFTFNLFAFLTGAFFFMWNGLYLGFVVTFLMSLVVIINVIPFLSHIVPIPGIVTLLSVHLICGYMANFFLIKKHEKLVFNVVDKVMSEKRDTYRNIPYIKFVIKKKHTSGKFWKLGKSFLLGLIMFYISSILLIVSDTGVGLHEALAQVKEIVRDIMSQKY